MVLFKELRQIVKTFVSKNNGKIAANYNMLVKLLNFLHKPSKVRIQFRSTTGNINCGEGWVGSKHLQAQLHRFACHDFLSVGACIYMTMPACLIAHFANIHL